MSAQQPPNGAESRLKQFLADRPDAVELSLAEIARQLGVSREIARLLLPDWRKIRERDLVERVRRVAWEHPDATRSGLSGGPSWKVIGAELTMSAVSVKRIWQKLGLADRHVSTGEELSARQAARQRRRQREPLRQERCVVCQLTFTWTVQMERGRRVQGRARTCSSACTREMRTTRGDSS